MRPLARTILVVTLLLACTGCDQLTKRYARSQLSLGVTTSYLHDTVRLVHSENVGAFLSAGERLPKPVRTALFQGLVGLIVLGLISAALWWRGLDRFHVVALTLMAASGLGNLLDRVLQDGSVTDFLNLGIGSLRTGIFNVADVCGVAAVAMLLLHSRYATANHGHEQSRDGQRETRSGG